MPEHSAISSSSTATFPAAASDVMLVQEQSQNDFGKLFTQKTSIQCKLSIGSTDDPLEDEADTMADRIMRMPEQNFIQRKCAHCEAEEKEEQIHRKSLSSFIQRKGSDSGVFATEAISNQIQSSRGNGSSIDVNAKSFMENRFGSDFSDVKIHTNNEATQMNRDLKAKAFTVGNDIYFNEGQYHPATNDGKHLLAHELTHVIQQKEDENIMPSRLIMRAPLSLEGDLNYTALSYTELDNEIKALQKYLDDKGVNDEETDHLLEQLDLYKGELARRKKLEDKPHKPKRRKQARVQPRSLKECFAIDDSLPDIELYEEIDLIHLGLQQGYSRKDTRRLKIALGILEAERMRRDGIRAESERKASIVSAFTKRIDEEADSSLLRVMKIVDSMKPSESKPGIYSMINEGKVIWITAEEFVRIRAQVQAQLLAANAQMRSIAQSALAGYEYQEKVDDECWITSFWTKTLGGIDDPGEDLKSNVSLVMTKTQLAKQLLLKGEFTKGAEKIISAAKFASDADAQYRTYVGNIQQTAGNIVGVFTIIRNVSIGLEAILLTGGAAAFVEGGGLATLGSVAGRGVLSLTLATAPMDVAAIDLAATGTTAIVDVAAAGTAVELPTAIGAATAIEAPAALAATDVAATALPTLASEAPAALAAIDTTVVTAAETTSAISTLTKAAAVTSLTTLSGDGSSDKKEDDQKKKCKPAGVPCVSPLPVLWPRELPTPPEETVRTLMRVSRGDLEWEGIERGRTQAEFSRQLSFWRNSGAQVPRELTCFAEDSEVNVPMDAHHIHPMYLNGEDAEWNLCGLETLRHLKGHARLDNQIELAEEYRACGICEYRLSRHPFGQQYIVVGLK